MEDQPIVLILALLILSASIVGIVISIREAWDDFVNARPDRPAFSDDDIDADG